MPRAEKSIEIIEAIREVTGPGKVSLQPPSITEAEIAAVARSLADDPVGYAAIDLFSARLADRIGVEHCLATSCGTSALQLALIAVGVQPDDEVLVPNLTFAGTANAVVHCGAVPNFVDVRGWDFGINPFKLSRYLAREVLPGTPATSRKTGRVIRACIAVDLLGTPCDIDAIAKECGRYGIVVIEDAAQALGSTYKGRPCAGNGFVSILSFNNNKIVTTNGGGALLTNDAFVMARAHALATTARTPHAWKMEHWEVAYNYRMGNINAALGLPQLERLDELLDKKLRLHVAYSQKLNVDVAMADNSTSNYWLNAVQLNGVSRERDAICDALTAEGIQCRTLFTPLNKLPQFQKCPRDNVDESIDLWNRTICLPSGVELKGAQ